MLTRFVVTLTALWLAPCLTVWAHHSYAAVDMAKRATIRGTVTTLEWTNPHVWLWISAADERGVMVPYAFESLSPSELTRFFGWNKRVVTSGQQLTVEYAPFRNGDRGGALHTITFADGRTLRGRPLFPAGGPGREGAAREAPPEAR
ncbi:hypothetical protein D3C83_04400 [compost metagenome]